MAADMAEAEGFALRRARAKEVAMPYRLIGLFEWLVSSHLGRRRVLVYRDRHICEIQDFASSVLPPNVGATSLERTCACNVLAEGTWGVSRAVGCSGILADWRAQQGRPPAPC